jgi:hypothetical protein
MSDTYWFKKGKFQKSYDYFFKKLVPLEGKADTPEGELLRMISRIYYRYNNDGDRYEDLLYDDNYYNITFIKNTDSRFFMLIHDELLDCYNESLLEKCIDRVMRYIILKNSTADKIWNPETQKLVSIQGRTGIKCLKMLDCQLKYSYEW